MSIDVWAQVAIFIPRVDGLSARHPGSGRHSLVSELR